MKRLILKALAVFICLAGQAIGQPAESVPPEAGAYPALSPTEALDNYPDLKAYLAEAHYLAPDSKLSFFRTGVDGSEVSQRAVFAIAYTGLADCGSRGCTFITVTRDKDGGFLLYDEFLGSDMKLMPGSHSGARDISIRTDNGELTGQFNGTRYVWSLAVKPEPAPLAKSEPQQFDGACTAGSAWHGYAWGDGQAGARQGAAGYGPCRSNRAGNFLTFECRQGIPDVTVKASMSTKDLSDSAPVTMIMTIGAQDYRFAGIGYYDAMSGFVLPEFDPIGLADPFFAALGSDATEARLSIGGHSKTIDLSGARDAVEMMLAACH